MNEFRQNTKRAIGQNYEDRAVEYLRKNAYKILARNVIYRFGEIDIVAESGDTLVFIEVRKRNTKFNISPVETITFQKQHRLWMSIQAYLARYRGNAQKVRIDLIGFEGDHLRHWKNFMTMLR